jgi:hypothetical protein
MATEEKNLINAAPADQTVENDDQNHVSKNLPEPVDPNWIEAQQALARGDDELFWEKCFASLSRKLDEQFAMERQFIATMLAKMQAMQEMGEIYRQVDKRLKDGEWDKCRGLSRDQQREVLTQIYNEELVGRMQQDVLNDMSVNWKEHRLRRIELIKWSKLPDSEKEKWLEFYIKPSPNINPNKGGNYAHQTQEHPQTSKTQETGEFQPDARAETTGPNRSTSGSV